MKGGDGILSNILMKSRSSKLFKKRPTVIPSTTRSTATTSPRDGKDQSIDGSESTLSSVHTGSMTGYAGNLSPPVIIPLHVLMYEDANADSVSLVTPRGRSASSGNDNSRLLRNKTTKKTTTTTTTNGRRRQAKSSDEAVSECKQQPRRPRTTRKKMTDNHRRKSAQKGPLRASHSTTFQPDNDIGKTSINIARMDSSNGSAVECTFTDTFVLDTFRNGSSICSSGSSCSSQSGDDE